MARSNDDDLGPGLLALGALALGVGAVIAIWSASETPADRALAAERSGGGDEAETFFGRYFGSSAPSDAGVSSPLASTPGAWGGGAPAIEEGEEDPQVLAMRRSFGDDAGMAASFTPYRHAGHAVVAAGLAGVSRSASCDVRVLPVRGEGGFNCMVRVRCDGVTVYPDSALEAGYAPCEVEGGVPRLATDGAPSDRDGDPELLVDLSGRRVRVHDIRHGTESTVEIELD